MPDNLQTPGELLQNARKNQDRSLQEVFSETKIPIRLLEAIERDDYHNLSGPIYVKSFLQSYAQCVGLDPQEMLDLYKRQFGGGEQSNGSALEHQRQDLGPQDIQAANIMPQTIAKPPVEDEVQGGDVWQEDVQVRRVGMSASVRTGIWVVLGVTLILIIFLLVKGFGGRDDSTTEGDGAESFSTSPPVRDENDVQLVADQGGDGLSTENIEEQPEIAEPESDQPVRNIEQPVETVAIQMSSEALADRLTRLNSDTLFTPPAAEMVDSQKIEGYERADLPRAHQGDSTLGFQDGHRYPLVLRLLCDRPVGAAVRWVGLNQPISARWPARPTPLPTDEIDPGRAYLVREGWVVYWGAEDHFDLRLDSLAGVQITLNGRQRILNESAIGRWQLLDSESSNNP